MEELWNAQTASGLKFQFWMPEGSDHDAALDVALGLKDKIDTDFNDWLVMVTMAALTGHNGSPILS